MKRRATFRAGLTAISITVAGLAAAGAPGCGSPRKSEPLAGPLRFSALDPEDRAAIRGRRVFMTNCYQCHPAGEAGLGPALNDKPVPAIAIRTQVREGLGAMPAFSEQEISDEELDNLVEYLFALRHN